MLQSLHGAASKWVGILLFSLLVLSFVIWGIADVFRDRVTKVTVAHVGPLEISGQQLQNQVQSELNYIRTMTGRSITLQQALETGTVARVLNNLIDRALLEQEAQRMGLRVPTSVVLNAIRDIPDFRTETGGFDSERFKQALAGAGMTEQTFLLDQRINLAREQLAKAATASVTVPPLLQKALVAAAAQRRTIETYRVKLTAQPLPAAPDDATLQKYLEDNRDAFMRPETRKLSFIRLTAADVADDVKVSDDEVAQAFETHKAELAVPEKRSFVQALTDSEDKAKAIAAAAAASHDLTAAAKGKGLTTTQLTGVTKADLPNELQDAAFALPAKGIAAPIQSPLGWHVVQVSSIAPAQDAALDKVKAKLTTDLREQKAADALVKRSQQVDDQLASGASLEEIASGLGLQVQQLSPINAKRQDEKGNSPALNQPQVLAAAFQLPEGKTSDLITAHDDKLGDEYYIVHADAVTPAAVKPLGEVKPQVLAAWQHEQRLKAAQAQADKITAALKDGKNYEAMASEFKVESALEKDLSRSGTLPAYLPTDFNNAIFALKKGEVSQTQPGKDGITVVRLRDIAQPVTIDQAKAATDAQTVEKLQDALASDAFAAYAGALRQRYPVKIDEGQIAQLFIDKSQQEY